MTTTETLQQLITTFEKLPIRTKHEATLLQIAGFPQLENVASNILAFYFDPQREHGLGQLFLSSLLSIIAPEISAEASYVHVEREHATAFNKRIDIVIQTDIMVIGIENKLYHSAINPFGEYRRHLTEMGQGRTRYGVLLCLDLPKDGVDLDIFLPLLHTQFLDVVVQKLPMYVDQAREPYISFLHDFIRTIKGHGRITYMNLDVLEFLQKNRTSIEQLLIEVEKLRDDMKYKIKQVETFIDTSIVSLPIIKGYFKEDNRLFYLLVYRIQLSEPLGLQININLSPDGWRINLLNYKGTQATLTEWLYNKNIPIWDRNTKPWRLGFGSDSLEYTSSPNEVAKEVLSLFTLICS